MTYIDDVMGSGECPRCMEKKDDIEEQYSFGVYAGVMCMECARYGYRDQCGHGRPQGTREDYEELAGPGTYEEDV
jgi:hypothetical protein